MPSARTAHPLSPPTPPLEVILVHPEIPPNTGNIARLCACTGSRLHLVAPLGFSLGDKDLRRSGLDYWDAVDVQTWGSLEELAEAQGWEEPGRTRLHLFSGQAARTLFETPFRPGDRLVFGRESRGLPPPLLDRYADRTVALPMIPGQRSLNLSSSAAIAVYEALRQCRPMSSSSLHVPDPIASAL